MIGAYLHSFIFAKVLGLFLVIMAIVMLSRADYYRDVFMNLGKEKTAVLTAASFSLIFGLFLIAIHNIWGWEAYVVVTIVSWLIVIKSVLWLAIPAFMARQCQKMYAGKMYYVSVGIVGVLGVLILSYGAFFLPLIEVIE